jgi:hypothetical protein
MVSNLTEDPIAVFLIISSKVRVDRRSLRKPTTKSLSFYHLAVPKISFDEPEFRKICHLLLDSHEYLRLDIS